MKSLLSPAERWSLWHEHFMATGSDPGTAALEADATVRGLYGTAPNGAPAERRVGFVASPPEARPSVAKAEGWRWADVVPMPPGSDLPLAESRRRGRGRRAA